MNGFYLISILAMTVAIVLLVMDDDNNWPGGKPFRHFWEDVRYA